MKPRVLVTGAGGFLGRWSVPALEARGFEVHALRHRSDADLTEPAAIDALLARVRPTHLLHFAWIATPGLYWTSPENERWLEAGTYLVRAFFAAGGRRAVLAGSCAEYDWGQAGVCHERSSPLADAAGPAPSAYAAAKLALSRRVAAIGTAAGGEVAWGRIFFQYGPGEHPARLVPGVVRSLLAGQEALCTPGTQVRSFLHAADVGDAFAALAGSDLVGAVNVGAAEAVSVAALVRAIAAQLGRQDLVRLGARPLPAGEPALLVPDVTRLHTELGWRPRFTLEDGIADTIAWWRTQ
jgi:nucleoside-diphosphate-sugar epimerase